MLLEVDLVIHTGTLPRFLVREETPDEIPALFFIIAREIGNRLKRWETQANKKRPLSRSFFASTPAIVGGAGQRMLELGLVRLV